MPARFTFHGLKQPAQGGVGFCAQLVGKDLQFAQPGVMDAISDSMQVLLRIGGLRLELAPVEQANVKALDFFFFHQEVLAPGGSVRA